MLEEGLGFRHLDGFSLHSALRTMGAADRIETRGESVFCEDTGQDPAWVLEDAQGLGKLYCLYVQIHNKVN